MSTTDRFILGESLGTVLMPGDDGFDAVRQAFNLLVDQRPFAVALPADEREVAAIVRASRRQGLRVAAQATGHNAAPLGSLHDTVLINTSRLASTHIDPSARIVRAGAGTKWGQIVPQLSGLGLAALHGSAPDVGIVGYSLGGGIGWLARSHGLQCNSVTAIELVTADGDLVRTDRMHEPDLFWALRGGGGSFGIVTSIEFTVYPVSTIYAGALFFGFERAGEIVRAWRDGLASTPDAMTTWCSVMHVPDLPSIPEPVRGGSFVVVLGAFTGPEGAGRELLAGLRARGPALDTFAMVAPEGLSGLAMDPPSPLPYRTVHEIVDDLSDETIDTLVRVSGPRSGLAVLQLRHGAGALARRPEGAGARASLPGTILAFAVGAVADDAAGEHLGRTLADVDAALADAQVGRYPSFVEEPADASAFYDAATWARLQRVKALYDGDDVIRGNHHVPPAA
jgi:FAD/FMN-containing dehydrogenase